MFKEICACRAGAEHVGYYFTTKSSKATRTTQEDKFKRMLEERCDAHGSGQLLRKPPVQTIGVRTNNLLSLTPKVKKGPA